MTETVRWPYTLPTISMTVREFEALPEYSSTLPTGTTPGKRWRREDGVYDRAFIARGGKPVWVVGEYDPNCPADAKTIKVSWYRPFFRVKAEGRPA